MYIVQLLCAILVTWIIEFFVYCIIMDIARLIELNPRIAKYEYEGDFELTVIITSIAPNKNMVIWQNHPIFTQHKLAYDWWCECCVCNNIALTYIKLGDVSDFTVKQDDTVVGTRGIVCQAERPYICCKVCYATLYTLKTILNSRESYPKLITSRNLQFTVVIHHLRNYLFIAGCLKQADILNKDHIYKLWCIRNYVIPDVYPMIVMFYLGRTA